LLFDIIYHHEQRSSNQPPNQPQLGYGDNLAQLGAKFRF
jgi:hypothetical protein